MDSLLKNRMSDGLIVLYFTTIVIYSFFVFYDYQPLKGFFGFIRIPVLLLLYYFTSVKRDYVYFLALFIFQITYLLFNKSTETSMFYGALASVIFRFLMIVIIYKAIREKEWMLTILAGLPFLFVHLFLIDLVKDVISNSIYLWILNGLLTALLGGISVSNYYYNPGNKSLWLLISCLFFVVQIGLFFINRFYLKQQIFLQLIIIIYGISNFTFYKFMIVKEKEECEPN
ncbi:hypothetical protein [Flavobacterium sp.]|uniref:hypothetical protein n=1 Tax=Flavobacterium sp. TaxID=239 RepID=UPI003D6C4064